MSSDCFPATVSCWLAGFLAGRRGSKTEKSVWEGSGGRDKSDGALIGSVGSCQDHKHRNRVAQGPDRRHLTLVTLLTWPTQPKDFWRERRYWTNFSGRRTRPREQRHKASRVDKPIILLLSSFFRTSNHDRSGTTMCQTGVFSFKKTGRHSFGLLAAIVYRHQRRLRVYWISRNSDFWPNTDCDIFSNFGS